jgi:hypothetical protein
VNSVNGDVDAYELADDELDVILSNTRNEIVAHVQGAGDSAAALVVLMAENDRSKPEALTYSEPVAKRQVPQRLAAVIETRCRAAEVHRKLGEVVKRARDLAVDLDRELSNHGDLTIAVLSALAFARHRDRYLVQLLSRARDLAVQVVYDLVRIRDLDRNLVIDQDAVVVHEHSRSDVIETEEFDGIRELDRLFAYNRQLAIDGQIREAQELSIRLERARRLSDFRERYRNLDRPHAHELAVAMDQALRNASELADSVLSHLDAVEVNAMSADLSQVRVRDLADLTGVIWTGSTIWPSEIADRVESLSHELAPGVWQIRPDGQRRAVYLGRDAVRHTAVPSGPLLG